MASPMVELLPQGNNYNPREGYATKRLREMQQRQMQTSEQPSQEMMMEESQPQGESALGYGARTIGRTAARVGEEVLGLPGNLIDVGLGLGSALTGNMIPTYGQIQEKLPISIPTSQNIKQGVTERLTGDYLKPKTSGEEYYDDLVGTTASLLIPGAGGLLKGGLKAAGKTIGKNAVLAFGADLAGRSAEKATGSPLAGGLVKVGALALGSTLMGSKKISTMINEQYDEARNIARTKNLRGETTKLSEDLTKVNKNIKGNLALSEAEEKEMGNLLDKVLNRVGKEREVSAAEALATPETTSRVFAPAAEGGAQEIAARGRRYAQMGKEGSGGLIMPATESVTKGGEVARELGKSRFFFEDGKIKLPAQITANDAMQMLQDVHAKWDTASRGEKRVLSGLSKSLNEFIKDVGNGNPKFLQAFKNGQELFRAKEAGPELLQWLNKNASFQNYLKNYIPISALGTALSLAVGPGVAAKGAFALGGLLAGKHAWNFINVIQQSPLAAKYFKELAVAASQNKSAAMINAFRKLDKVSAKIT